MSKSITLHRDFRAAAGRTAWLLCAWLLSVPASALDASPGALKTPATAARLEVARSGERLRPRDIGLVINVADPYSEQVGAHYAAARGLADAQVLRVSLPLRGTLTVPEFNQFRQAIADRFGPEVQALALAWVAPFAVECNSITGALALGFDGDLCRASCGVSRPSRYFNSASARPWSELSLRPSMLLAARSVEQARALIDRGVAADGSLTLRGRPPVNAMFLRTDDLARSVRQAAYPPQGFIRAAGVDVRVARATELPNVPRLLMAITGSVQAPVEAPLDWVPGGLGDHLTSFGGSLTDGHGQGTALDWIASGATASHGSVSEPCNHLQKFPHPLLLLGHYLQGSTAIEAYWKSVAWPQQSLFVGEPLAAPFAPRRP